MSELPLNPSSSSSSDSSESLTDRIVARVIEARLAIESKRRPKRSLRRRDRVPSYSASTDSTGEGAKRETQSLKRVFREMGNRYRRYRSQTGDPVLPALREAAYAFRAAPSLPALIAVAVFLDDLDLLS